jgi:hypothetical protein
MCRDLKTGSEAIEERGALPSSAMMKSDEVFFHASAGQRCRRVPSAPKK